MTIPTKNSSTKSCHVRLPANWRHKSGFAVLEYRNGGGKGECYADQAVKEFFQGALASIVK
jgi:hypothetical protein